MSKGSSIGHFNVIKCKSLDLGKNAKIGHLNMIKGYLELIMDSDATIVNCNRMISLRKSKTYQLPKSNMRSGAKIVSRHFFDLTSNIEIGERSNFAGAYSRCWTHSFLYGKKKHVRLDGDIIIGQDCYIGASCILLPGISIGNNITLGAGTTCSKSIEKQGLYVSSSLKYIAFDADERIASLGEPSAVIDGMERFHK